MLSLKSALAELQARGEGRIPVARDHASALHEAVAEMANVRDVVKRQKMISGFWIAPREVFTRKLAEVRTLEARLGQLEGATEVVASQGGATPIANPSVESALPTLWTAHLDSKNGQTYYYNESSGESTYSPRPV